MRSITKLMVEGPWFSLCTAIPSPKEKEKGRL